MAQPVLVANTRKTKGKGPAGRLRRSSQIPAVFYGPKTGSIPLTVYYPELEKIIRDNAGENILLDLQIKSDQGTEIFKAMLRDIQVDPIKDTYLHIDFYEISMDKKITVHIPLHLVNTPIGVKEGGILQHIRRELEVSCFPDKLQDFLELDVSELDIGDALHVGDVPLPDGIECLEDGHLTVAVVAAPSVVSEAAIEEEEFSEEELAEREKETAEQTEFEEKGGEE